MKLSVKKVDCLKRHVRRVLSC